MTPKTRQERVQDHIQLVADTLIQQIEAGTAPWQKPWKPGERPYAHNLLTGNDYQGYNQVWLMMAAHAETLTDTRWGTYRQIKEAGGQVRKGEKGHPILAIFEVGQKEREAKEQEARDRGEPVHRVSRTLLPRVYTVFNASQADGLPPLVIKKPSWEPCEKAEGLLNASGVKIVHGGDRAFYDLKRDFIQLPHASQFESKEEYYAAALHELAHASGHPSRMDRELVGFHRDSAAYAREELRAEISALFTCTQLGLGYTSQNGAAYVREWVSYLREAPEEIRLATSEAQKMSSYVLRGMGKETTLPDLSWTVPEPPSPMPIAAKDTPTQRSWRGVTMEEDLIRTVRSDKKYLCQVLPSHPTPGLTALKGALGQRVEEDPEQAARAHLESVRRQNPGQSLLDFKVSVHVQDRGKRSSRSWQVRDLAPPERELERVR